jgi:hypothetical protein
MVVTSWEMALSCLVAVHTFVSTLTINADANLTANTNLLNTAIGDENITGDANLTLNSLLLK